MTAVRVLLLGAVYLNCTCLSIHSFINRLPVDVSDGVLIRQQVAAQASVLRQEVAELCTANTTCTVQTVPSAIQCVEWLLMGAIQTEQPQEAIVALSLSPTEQMHTLRLKAGSVRQSSSACTCVGVW